MNDPKENPEMIGYAEAQREILARVMPRPAVQLPIMAARNSVLAEDVSAPFPLPRFDHSAVDGFAIRAKDASSATTAKPVTLSVSSVVRTGSVADKPVTENTAVQVFTGAMLPEGADTVVMVEDVQRGENEIVLVAPAAPHKNIRRVGEEFAAGSTCLRAKQKLTPPTVALLASLGMESVRVHSAPRIALVITGSELVEPGQALGPAKIYNSNRYGIEAALADIGLSVTSLFITADHENELRDTLRNAVQQADVILTSGGVSVGDVDYVKPALLSLGATIHFDKVAIKPGKPFVFATLDEKFFFGLPGNPVSALVTYLLFVKPALVKMLGSRSFLPSHRTASLGCDVQKRNPRTEFVRGRFADDTGNTIEPCRGQESHMLGGLASADAMIVLEGEPRMLRMGEEVEVMPISWS